MLDDNTEGKEPAKIFEWHHHQKGKTATVAGFLVVEENGEIAVCVDDDYYNGRFSVDDARALMEALQEVFEQR